MKTSEETSSQIFVVVAWMAMLLTSNLTILLETKGFLMAWFIHFVPDVVVFMFFNFAAVSA